MKTRAWAIVLILFVTGAVLLHGHGAKLRPANFPLDSMQGLNVINGRPEIVTYKGRGAIHFSSPQPLPDGYPDNLAILRGTDFKDGTIEVDVVGFPGKDADADNRGFVGLAFRVQGRDRGEYFFLRPTNGRADDQLRRNHSVQYESMPDYSWKRLRTEHPGSYESYADLEPGVWTRMKIVVSGTKAQLYVNGAAQPCLVVNDLKLGDAHGQIAIWTGVGTEGYFSNLRVY
jgi:hypothetical protein